MERRNNAVVVTSVVHYRANGRSTTVILDRRLWMRRKDSVTVTEKKEDTETKKV